MQCLAFKSSSLRITHIQPNWRDTICLCKREGLCSYPHRIRWLISVGICTPSASGQKTGLGGTGLKNYVPSRFVRRTREFLFTDSVQRLESPEGKIKYIVTKVFRRPSASFMVKVLNQYIEAEWSMMHLGKLKWQKKSSIRRNGSCGRQDRELRFRTRWGN